MFQHVQDMKLIKLKFFITSNFFGAIFCILSLSCENKSVEDGLKSIVFSYKDIKNKVDLSGRKYDFDEFLEPGRLLYKKNRIIVLDPFLNGYLAHLIDAESMNYVQSTAVKGDGPKEMPSAWLLDSGYDVNSFWIYSLEAKTISKYDLQGLNTSSDFQVKQNQNFYSAMNLVWSSDSTFMTFLTAGPNRFVEFRKDGLRIGEYGFWKGLIPGNHPDHVVADLHQGKLSGSSNQNHFLKASLFRDHLDILDKKTGLITTVDGPVSEIPEFEAASYGVVTNNPRLAYMDSFIGENFIFGLYSGMTDEEIIKKGRGENQLIMFDLNGNPLTLFKLNIKIKNFTVDEKHKRIFGITVDENPGIVVYHYD